MLLISISKSEKTELLYIQAVVKDDPYLRNTGFTIQYACQMSKKLASTEVSSRLIR